MVKEASQVEVVEAEVAVVVVVFMVVAVEGENEELEVGLGLDRVIAKEEKMEESFFGLRQPHPTSTTTGWRRVKPLRLVEAMFLVRERDGSERER